MANKLTVALIDDDPAVLDSTAMLLRGNGFDTAVFSSAEAFLSGHARMVKKPDCIVSDVRMPGMSGLMLLEQLPRHAISAPLVLITGHGDIQMAVEAIKGGASNFIEKPFAIEVLAAAIQEASASAKLELNVAKERVEIAARIEQLSARQREVMDMVVEGYSSRQIAEKLGISPRTVETYRLSIMEKMGAGSVAALVRMATLWSPP